MKAWNLCNHDSLTDIYENQRNQTESTHQNSEFHNFHHGHELQGLRKKISLKKTTKNSPQLYPCLKMEAPLESASCRLLPTPMNIMVNEAVPTKIQPKIIFSVLANQPYKPEPLKRQFTDTIYKKLIQPVHLKISYESPPPPIIISSPIHHLSPEVEAGATPPPNKVIRRVNTLPNFFRSCPYRQEWVTRREWSKVEKSVHQEPVGKTASRRIDQLKCTSAESIPDSMDNSEEFSIVLSDFSELGNQENFFKEKECNNILA